MYETTRTLEFDVGDIPHRVTDCEVYARDGSLEVRKIGVVEWWNANGQVAGRWVTMEDTDVPGTLTWIRNAIHAALIRRDDVAAIEQECADIELSPTTEYNSEERDMDR